MRVLVDAGVDSIIDLTTDDDPLDPYDELLSGAVAKVRREVRHFKHPIPDNGVIDHAGYDRILARIRGEMDAGRLVCVHRLGGKGRTSTVIGCLLANQGLDYESTIARIAELRARTCKAQDRCPETPVQHRLLRARLWGELQCTASSHDDAVRKKAIMERRRRLKPMESSLQPD